MRDIDMSYELNEKEFDNVIKLGPEERYNYFVKKVCDWKEVWSIGDSEGWALLGDNQERESAPVWLAKRYAEAYCTGEWAGKQPKVIPLDDWMVKWIPGMIADNRYVAVFPTQTGKGIVVHPQQLMDSLKEELENYE